MVVRRAPAARARRGRGRVAEADPAHRPWAARVVDRYLPDGRVRRDVVFVAGVVRGGRVSSVVVAHRASDEPIAMLANGPKATVLRAAHDAFLAWARARRAEGERIDSPMPWAPAASLRDDDGRWLAGTTLYPQRLRFDRESGRWARRPGVGTARWALAEPLDVAESEARKHLGRRRDR